MKWKTFTSNKRYSAAILPRRFFGYEQAFACININGSVTYLFTETAQDVLFGSGIEDTENVVVLKKEPYSIPDSAIDLYESQLP